MTREFKYFNTMEPVYTGDRYHQAFLGSVDVENPDYKKDLEKIKRPSNNPNINYFVSFEDSLLLVRKYQPLIDRRHPEKGRVSLNDPEKDFLAHLRNAIIDELEPENPDNLRVYTAEGSPLDHLHGTDVVIDIDGKILTLDITLKRTAKDKKADVIALEEIPDPKDKEHKNEYWGRVDAIANEIAVKFLKENYRGIDRKYPHRQDALHSTRA